MPVIGSRLSNFRSATCLFGTRYFSLAVCPGMRSRGLGVEVAVGFPRSARVVARMAPERRAQAAKRIAEAGSGHMGKPRARRAKAVGEPKASEGAQPGSGAPWSIVDRFLQRKRRPDEAASLLLTGGWLISGNADTQRCTASRGDRTRIRIAPRYVSMMIADVQLKRRRHGQACAWFDNNHQGDREPARGAACAPMVRATRARSRRALHRPSRPKRFGTASST
jgi:hypothetical protein